MIKGTSPFRALAPFACAALFVCAAANTNAVVRLPRIFGSHMVLQQDKPLIFWGWADPGESVTVTIGSDSRQVTANDKGQWKLSLPERKAGGPLTVKVSASNSLVFEDVLVGEVWLASGQSNMEMGIGACRNGKEEIAAADHPQIRLFMAANRWTPEPQSDLETNKVGEAKPEGIWKVCSPKTVAEGGWGGFSAAAYYFGRELQKDLSVPVGLIDATWGGTKIESWTAPEGFEAVPALQREYEKVQLGDARTIAHQHRLQEVIQETEQWIEAARKALKAKAAVPTMPVYPKELLPPNELQQATALYNGMIHPIHPFPMRGMIWYQGESNVGDTRYTERMQALIAGWRKVWSDPDLAFYYVQIAPYNYGGNAERVGEFWEMQAKAQAVPNSGMVVINDIGDLRDIHPANKQDIGARLAAWALAKQYGKRNVVCSGPTFKSLNNEGTKLRVTFDNAAGGLKSRDGKPLTWFEVIDADKGRFVRADAVIEEDSVTLSAPGVNRPVAVRFAWSMLAEPNLMNSAKLPAGAFRAGDVPKRDLLSLNVPEADQYRTVLELDLSKLGPSITYDVDHRSKIGAKFDRIAYYVELQSSDGNAQFLYVSMDAFSDSLDKIGIPTAASGGRFQQNVAHMNVYSNVRDIVTGTNLAGGNMEFWPDNYGTGNSANISNASAQVYDFGDQPSDPRDGYGCMQVHNHDAKQTLFAINHWREGNSADIGIGNRTTGNPDWTFAANAGNWTAKRLRVMARMK